MIVYIVNKSLAMGLLFPMNIVFDMIYLPTIHRLFSHRDCCWLAHGERKEGRKVPHYAMLSLMSSSSVISS